VPSYRPIASTVKVAFVAAELCFIVTLAAEPSDPAVAAGILKGRV
jgi:hypothetical protein